MTKALTAPFPYFGGKRRIAERVWRALGNVDHYVEPFCGSAAVLLARPDKPHRETINDADGMVCNFWRAVKHGPDGVWQHADWPVIEIDMHARNEWLIGQRESMTERLTSDPDWFDARIAGWWCWGAAAWLGTGWAKIASRQIPCIKPTGRQIGTLSMEWVDNLHRRFRGVDVTSGNYLRVLTPSALRLGHVKTTGIFFDPPYAKGNVQYAAGGVGTSISSDVEAWCLQHGDVKSVRIALCGLAGEHAALESAGWRMEEWSTAGGFSNASADTHDNSHEAIWFSPNCLGGKHAEPLFAGIV